MMVDVFRETFCYMPLAYVLKQKVIALSLLPSEVVSRYRF